MSAGAIPVSTDNKGVRDIVEDGHSGYITKPGRPASLVAWSEALLRHPDQEESMRKQGWERSRAFSWNHSANQLEALFNTKLMKEAA